MLCLFAFLSSFFYLLPLVLLTLSMTTPVCSMCILSFIFIWGSVLSVLWNGMIAVLRCLWFFLFRWMVLTVIWELGVYSLQYYVGGGVILVLGEIFLYGLVHITLASLFYSFALVHRCNSCSTVRRSSSNPKAIPYGYILPYAFHSCNESPQLNLTMSSYRYCRTNKSCLYSCA